MQVNNSSAIEFYKQFDFEIVETKQHYYKRIEPADAYVLQKTLKKKDGSASTPVAQTNGVHAPTAELAAVEISGDVNSAAASVAVSSKA